MSEPIGVLLMAYGTPASIADVPAYYTHIRHGRPPEPAALAELVGRYEAIGGSSPLRQITQAQAAALEAQLANRSGQPVRVALGMKHAAPFIEQGVAELIDAGVRSAVALVLAPHYSPLSVGEYIARASAAAGSRIELAFVEDLAPRTRLRRPAGATRRRVAQLLPEAVRDAVDVVFTAHSLPARVLAADDPYPGQLRETAAAVAARLQLPRWSTGWQSAGRTTEPWLGPDILQIIRELAAAGSTGVVVCPAGFVSDHLEILYDLDVACRTLASELGLTWGRTRSPNSDPLFVAALCDIVMARLHLTAAVG